MAKNLYEQKTAFIPAEEARLQSFNFPFHASTTLLSSSFPKLGKLIDVGAGSSPKLAEWTIENGGTYTGVDIQMKFLQSLRHAASSHYRAAITIKEANVRALQFKANSFDTSHTRFVLSHITNSQERLPVIRKILSIAPQAAFLDNDWSSIRATGLAEDFIKAAVNFFKISPFIPNYGLALCEEVTQVLKEKATVIQTVFTREAGDYYSELLLHAQSLQNAPQVGQLPDTKQTADEIVAKLESLHGDYSKLPAFTPPNIIGVTVYRENPKQKNA